MDQGHVELPCPKCRQWQQLDAEATERRCESCGTRYWFQTCPTCGDVAQVGRKAHRAGMWGCPSCDADVKVGFIIRPERGTAARLSAQMTAKGRRRDDAEFRSLGGLRVVTSRGYDFAPPTVCSVSCAADELRILPAGQLEPTVIPYASVTAAEIAEGEQSESGNYEYKTFSGNAAADLGGEVLSGILNALSGKKTTVLRVVSREGEIVLVRTIKPEQMRETLARLFALPGIDRSGAATGGA